MFTIDDDSVVGQVMPPRATVVLETGGRVFLCRCWKSEKFPYCDGSHKKYHNGCYGPVEVIVCETQET